MQGSSKIEESHTMSIMPGKKKKKKKKKGVQERGGADSAKHQRNFVEM